MALIEHGYKNIYIYIYIYKIYKISWSFNVKF